MRPPQLPPGALPRWAGAAGRGRSFGRRRILRRGRFSLLELDSDRDGGRARRIDRNPSPRAAIVRRDGRSPPPRHRDIRAPGQTGAPRARPRAPPSHFDVVGASVAPRRCEYSLTPSSRQLNRRADIARSDAYPAVCGRRCTRDPPVDPVEHMEASWAAEIATAPSAGDGQMKRPFSTRFAVERFSESIVPTKS